MRDRPDIKLPLFEVETEKGWRPAWHAPRCVHANGATHCFNGIYTGTMETPIYHGKACDLWEAGRLRMKAVTNGSE